MKRNIRFTECSLWIDLSGCIRKATAAPARSTWQIIFSRRELARLTDLDDRMLADIGLTRSDLIVAGSAPLWQNPTSILEQRVSSRRAAMPRAILQSDELTVPHHSMCETAMQGGSRSCRMLNGSLVAR